LRRKGVLFLRGDRRGQSAAVGTILAIMVILTLLTVVTTRWIPVWVEGREAEHAAHVDAQFQELKKTVDQQALITTPGVAVGNPITLGQPGVPVFAPGSAGTIFLGGSAGGLFANQMTFENDSKGFAQTAYGAVKYSTINTRFVQQAHLYEFGAVIINQSDGQLLKVGPSISFDNASGHVQVQFTMISVAGDGTTYTGDETIGVRTQLLFAPVRTSINYTTDQSFWLNITSESAGAWAVFLNKTLSSRLTTDQYSINYAAGSNVVSVHLLNVNKILVSYQVYQTELDIA
jgi:hypothetical protein